MKLQQIKRPLPTEMDDEVPIIDLSDLTTTTDQPEKDFESILRPGEWCIIPTKGKWIRYNIDGTVSTYYALEDRLCFISDTCTPRDPPTYRNLAGQRVTPTRVSSLLTQNPSGTSTRPASTSPEWDQTDERHYYREAKKSLPQFLAETTESYYMVPELSPLRLLLKCSKYSQATPMDSDIAVHVDPKTSQASFVCPICSHANRKEVGGSGHHVRHAIPREQRQKLEVEGIIPEKKYKYADRASEVDDLLKLISENPGESPFLLDKEMSWPNGTALRLINVQLQNKVRLVKGRKGHKGYRVYPN